MVDVVPDVVGRVVDVDVLDVVEAFSPHPARLRIKAMLTNAQNTNEKEACRFMECLLLPSECRNASQTEGTLRGANLTFRVRSRMRLPRLPRLSSCAPSREGETSASRGEAATGGIPVPAVNARCQGLPPRTGLALDLAGRLRQNPVQDEQRHRRGPYEPQHESAHRQPADVHQEDEESREAESLDPRTDADPIASRKVEKERRADPEDGPHAHTMAKASP